MEFKICYTNGEEEFDYLEAYQGLQSLSAMTRALLITLHALASEEIIKHATAARGFEFSLGKSREGSFLQSIYVLFHDDAVRTILLGAGGNLATDFVKWAIGSVVGNRQLPANRNLRKKIAKLERWEGDDDLQAAIERSILEAHLPIRNQNLSIDLYHNRTKILSLNRQTLDYLEYEDIAPDIEIAHVGVSRFNVRTCTGRFIHEIDSESIPFRSANRLSERDKTTLAENLALVGREIFEPVRVEVRPVYSRHGKIKYYILLSVVY